MLTEEQVRTAVAKGIVFLNRTREPYGLWFMSMMHRLFGVREFADALARYDEVVADRPAAEAAVLRVLRRLNDANNPLKPDDWDRVNILTDQLLACALYCDRLGLPPAYPEALEQGIRAGGYHATHVLLAWIWLRDNRCRLAVREGFEEDMYRANVAILEERLLAVNDLKLEAAAFLCMARQGSRVEPRFVAEVVSIQRADGGWGKLDTPDPANPEESSWHSTTLALLLLLHVKFPGAQGAGHVEQKAKT
jgi:hypothetical protein